MRILFVVALFFGAFVNLLAQETPRVVLGNRVRISAPTVARDRLVGTFVAQNADTLLLKVENQIAALKIPLAALEKFEVSRGRKSKALVGGGIGLLVLGTTGGIIGHSIGDEDPDASFEGFGVLFGAPAGFLLGASIGAFVKVEQWEEIPIER